MKKSADLLRLFLVLCVSLFAQSCGKDAATKNSPRVFGHSFNVIESVDGASYLLNGYSSFEASRSQWSAPGAVLIIGPTDGVELGGERFSQGSVVLVEDKDGQAVFRLARPGDRIELRDANTNVFGKAYPKGPFPVPDNGMLKPVARKSEKGGTSDETQTAKVSLRMLADADTYTLRREEAFSTAFEMVDGKMQYPKLKAKGPVVGVFRNREYKSELDGVFEIEDMAGNIAQHVRGAIIGTSVVAQATRPRPNSVSTNFVTRCRVLDEYPQGRYLVDGIVEFQDGSIFLVGPAAMIENARDDKSPVILTDVSGAQFRIEHGKKVTLDSAGRVRASD